MKSTKWWLPASIIPGPTKAPRLRTTRARWARAFAALVAAGTVLLVASPPAGASGTEQIQGSGSSWAYLAVEQWVSSVHALQQLQVVYTPSGSAQGRTDYANGVTDFAVSDIGYQGQNPITGGNDSSSRPYAYLPIVGGATAFPYNIVAGGQRITNLRLSGLTLAKIFTDQITNWDDPEITADNNGRQLPSIPIVPVIHSEGAGTTFQFTDYLNTEYPSLWQSFSGYHFPVEFWPTGKGSQVAENGSDGVMSFITSAAGQGSIGFDEYAYALGANFPVIALENSAGWFTMPDAYDAAVSLTQAQINYTPGPNYLLETLNRVYAYNDPRTYPLSSYSYEILPTAPSCGGPASECDRHVNTPKRQTLADFDTYSLCQGQSSMATIGYSPLPINLVEASFQQVSILHRADPAVSLASVNVALCNNPTFIPGQPDANYLAKVAPFPPACAQAGQGPCPGQYARNGNPVAGRPPAANTGAAGGPSGGGTGSGGGSGAGGSGSGSGGGGSAGGGSSSSSGQGPGNAAGAGSGGGAAVAAGTGRAATGGSTATTSGAGSNGSTGTTSVQNLLAEESPTNLASAHPGGLGTLAIAIIAALLVLLVVVGPVLLARARHRVPGGKA